MTTSSPTAATHARRLLAVVLAVLGAAAGLQLATAPPAAAGQLGLTIEVRGAAEISVIEGAVDDGASRSCDHRDNLDDRVVHTCARIRSSAVFASVVWLRVTPLVSETDEWVADNWTGCDSVRHVKGRQYDCMVESAAFSSTEKTVRGGAYDNTRPVLTSWSQQRSTTKDLTSTYTMSATQGTLECRPWPATEYRPCSSGVEHTWPAAGQHVMSVRAVDPSGNTSNPEALADWHLDTVVRSGPTDRTGHETAEFVVDSPEATSIECAVNGGAWSTCGTPGEPLTVTRTAHGLYSLAVRGARDGSVDEVPARWEWQMGYLPETVLDSAVLDGRQVQARFHGEHHDSFQCRMDGPEGWTYDWVACQSPVTLDDLPDGDYRFEVRARDDAGRVDPTPVVHSFSVRTPDPGPDPGPGNPGPGPVTPTLPTTARVVSVVDADTLLVQAGRARFRVDLAGLTPPARPRCTVRSGKRALVRAARPGSTVRLIAVRGSRTTGTGATPWTVLVGTRDLAQAQLGRGLARLDTREAPPTRRAAYASAQRQAKRAHRGVWGRC
ncbi:thermonuclease family protein [Nocardioides litoris]|uniref:thermonuclease family protein n=1 Tax=Nocardioides litoris TaxID=1926648 RepID=UPI001122ADBF|nr:hypothetical protein [Nocardioides litoris]